MTTGKLVGEPAVPVDQSWLSGVRQGGTQPSAALHRLADRPELSLAKRRWRFAVQRTKPVSPKLPEQRRRTTEYPANGSSVSRSHAREKNMVKPHGSLVPVSLTPRGASTPGLSTWSSTRSLQRSCDLGDLISWRVSRLDAFSVSPFRT